MEIDIEKDKSKYQSEVKEFTSQLQEIEQKRMILIQAIQERNGILAYLVSLKPKE